MLWRDQHDDQVNGLMHPLPTLIDGKGCAFSLNHPWIAALATLRAFEGSVAYQPLIVCRNKHKSSF
jgi:hypothetical protein